MTILRNFFFRMLFKKIAFQLISLNQRYPSKKCADNKVAHFSLNLFLYLIKYIEVPLIIDFKGSPVIIRLLWKY